MSMDQMECGCLSHADLEANNPCKYKAAREALLACVEALKEHVNEHCPDCCNPHGMTDDELKSMNRTAAALKLADAVLR